MKFFEKSSQRTRDSFRVTLNFREIFDYRYIITRDWRRIIPARHFPSLERDLERSLYLLNKVRIIRLGFPKHSVALARQPAGYTAVVGIRTLRFQRSLNKIRDRKSS